MWTAGIILLGVIVIVAGVLVFLAIWNDPVRCRRRYRAMVAAKVLSLADALDDHQLHVGWPFPGLQLDPKRPPEEWNDRPRRCRMRATQTVIAMLAIIYRA